MLELTQEQHDAVESSATPPQLVDPMTKKEYVLLPATTYARLRRVLEMDDYDPDEGLGYVNEVMADDDAHDPLLEQYQRLGKTR